MRKSTRTIKPAIDPSIYVTNFNIQRRVKQEGHHAHSRATTSGILNAKGIKSVNTIGVNTITTPLLSYIVAEPPITEKTLMANPSRFVGKSAPHIISNKNIHKNSKKTQVLDKEDYDEVQKLLNTLR